MKGAAVTKASVDIQALRTANATGSAVFERWRQELSGQHRVVSFADGEDQRSIRAAAALAAEGILSPRLVGRSQKIRGFASQLGCDVPQEWIFDVGELAQDSTVSAMIGEAYERKPEQLDQVRQKHVHLASGSTAGRVR